MYVLLHYTGVTGRFGGFCYQRFNLTEVFRHSNILAAVGVLPRLDDPYVMSLSLFVGFFFLFCISGSIIESLKLRELRVSYASLHMESHRQGQEGVLAKGFIIVLEVDEQGLLVSEVVIII